MGHRLAVLGLGSLLCAGPGCVRAGFDAHGAGAGDRQAIDGGREGFGRDGARDALRERASDAGKPVDGLRADGMLSGGHLWSRRFGAGGDQFANSVAVDSKGNIYLTGFFTGTINLGAGALYEHGGQDIFIASFTPGGAHRWSKSFGGSGNESANALAVDAAGNVYVTGDFEGTSVLGRQLTTKAQRDIFLASFTHDGYPRWSKRFALSGNNTGVGLAAGGAQQVVLTGYGNGVLDFGGGQLPATSSESAFVASFGPDGVHLWSHRFPTARAFGQGAAVDATGNVFITGHHDGGTDFGAGPLASKGGSDVYVASFNSLGQHRWSKSYGGTGGDGGNGIHADAAGNVLVTGWYSSAMDFGGPALPAGNSNGDVFVAKLANDGAHIWSAGFVATGSSLGSGGNSVTTDAAGNIFVTGLFSGQVDFRSGPISSAGQADIFVAHFQFQGDPVWSKRFGGPGGEWGRWVTYAPGPSLLIAGHVESAVDFGGGVLPSGGGVDCFLLALKP